MHRASPSTSVACVQEDVACGEVSGVAARAGRQRITATSPRPRMLDPLDDARADPLDRPEPLLPAAGRFLPHAL